MGVKGLDSFFGGSECALQAPYDYVHVDMNCVCHISFDKLEEPVIDDRTLATFRSMLDRIVQTVMPRHVHLCFDGPSVAKFTKQRERRANANGSYGSWRCLLTPGTEAMLQFEAAAQAWGNTFAGTVDISRACEPGEGEHKIFARIRTVPELRHAVVSRDSDIFLAGLVTAARVHYIKILETNNRECLFLVHSVWNAAALAVRSLVFRTNHTGVTGTFDFCSETLLHELKNLHDAMRSTEEGNTGAWQTVNALATRLHTVAKRTDELKLVDQIIVGVRRGHKYASQAQQILQNSYPPEREEKMKARVQDLNSKMQECATELIASLAPAIAVAAAVQQPLALSSSEFWAIRLDLAFALLLRGTDDSPPLLGLGCNDLVLPLQQVYRQLGHYGIVRVAEDRMCLTLAPEGLRVYFAGLAGSSAPVPEVSDMPWPAQELDALSDADVDEFLFSILWQLNTLAGTAVDNTCCFEFVRIDAKTVARYIQQLSAEELQARLEEWERRVKRQPEWAPTVELCQAAILPTRAELYALEKVRPFMARINTAGLSWKETFAELASLRGPVCELPAACPVQTLPFVEDVWEHLDPRASEEDAALVVQSPGLQRLKALERNLEAGCYSGSKENAVREQIALLRQTLQPD
eukprot:TRINITY_DN13454_c0_g1_i1.p1 TRINITY_DN13454_c0_g1~~TRINITY_DN13454_c0_g1_i1.p1  ORF type:complete len:637 (+),score=93.52 TRINITY_DN13454_c0_g1_i1:1576-3486(+)